MKCMKKLERFMNDWNIRKKLFIIYVFCVILPLVLTDSIILYMIYDAGQREQLYKFENIVNSIRYDLEYTIEEAVNQMNDVYVDNRINDFLDKEYESPYAFFEASVKLDGKSSLSGLGGYNISNAVIYADNDTIINGGHFSQLSGVKGTVWYQQFIESGRNMSISFYYIGDEDMSALLKRRISLVRRLDYFKKDGCEKILRVDVDYNRVARKLTQLNYGYGVYICQGDRILFSNRGHSGSNEDFHELSGTEAVAYKSTFNLYGVNLDVLCMEEPSSLFSYLKKHMPLMVFLLVVNFLLPVVMVSIVNRSFTRRLWELGAAFEKVEEEGTLQGIEHVQGKDEIGTLMRNYNRMVCRMNELIQRVYKNRLERQEMELARQNAELLALHSQINPHFLFNVLESIRMHCVIQKEDETAGMIEKLAVLERQNINWASDNVKLSEEINFVEAYLELQKYRFGSRLHYEIELAESCAGYYIPKLTLTTFVENSCVHGMERKASACWIYLRIYEKNERLCIEIEDTGGGMEEQTVEQINQKMQNCSIEDIRENEHIGIINACLRLKRFAEGHADFSLESEMGVGTFTTIQVDAGYLKQNAGGEKTNGDEVNAGG